MIKRVFVCGERGYNNKNRVYSVLDGVRKKFPRMMVVHQADKLANEWAEERGLVCEPCPDDCERSGLDFVVAFGHDESVEDILHRARMAGVLIMRVG